MEKYQWAIRHKRDDDEVMIDSMSDSADAAIKSVCDRIGNNTTYEKLIELGFSLVRVKLKVNVIG